MCSLLRSFKIKYCHLHCSVFVLFIVCVSHIGCRKHNLPYLIVYDKEMCNKRTGNSTPKPIKASYTNAKTERDKNMKANINECE